MNSQEKYPRYYVGTHLLIFQITTKLTLLSSWSVAWSLRLIILYTVLPPSQYAVIIRYVFDQWVTLSLSIGNVYCFVDKQLLTPVISKITSTASTDANQNETDADISMNSFHAESTA